MHDSSIKSAMVHQGYIGISRFYRSCSHKFILNHWCYHMPSWRFEWSSRLLIVSENGSLWWLGQGTVEGEHLRSRDHDDIIISHVTQCSTAKHSMYRSCVFVQQFFPVIHCSIYRCVIFSLCAYMYVSVFDLCMPFM